VCACGMCLCACGMYCGVCEFVVWCVCVCGMYVVCVCGMWVLCVRVSVCHAYVGALGSQKRLSYLLEPELQEIVSPLSRVREPNFCSLKRQQAPLAAELSF